MRVVGPLVLLTAWTAAFAPNAWANPSNTDSSDVWVGTIVVGVIVGFFLVLLGSRRRSRWKPSFGLGRLAIVCLGLILVVLSVYGFSRGRPVQPPTEPIAGAATDSERMSTIRFGGIRHEGVDGRWSAVALVGLGLIAFGMWPRRAAAPRRHTRIVPPLHATAGHEIEESSPERGTAAP